MNALYGPSFECWIFKTVFVPLKKHDSLPMALVHSFALAGVAGIVDRSGALSRDGGACVAAKEI